MGYSTALGFRRHSNIVVKDVDFLRPQRPLFIQKNTPIHQQKILSGMNITEPRSQRFDHAHRYLSIFSDPNPIFSEVAVLVLLTALAARSNLLSITSLASKLIITRALLSWSLPSMTFLSIPRRITPPGTRKSIDHKHEALSRQSIRPISRT